MQNEFSYNYRPPGGASTKTFLLIQKIKKKHKAGKKKWYKTAVKVCASKSPPNNEVNYFCEREKEGEAATSGRKRALVVDYICFNCVLS